MWKHFSSGYLDFTKKERTGITVLLFGILFFTVLPFFYPYFIKPETYDYHDFEKAIASLRLKQADSSDRFGNGKPGKPVYPDYAKRYSQHDDHLAGKAELFYFDPNLASGADWKRLGLRDKTIATIQNYVSKGGKFYQKEDIGKIWGLHKDEIQRLLPYVQIHTADAANYAAEKKYEKKGSSKPEHAVSFININEADTAAFISLPGIGSKLSGRIIHFRDKLGGFYKVEQVGETFGLPDSTFQKIKPWLKINGSDVKQININTASIEEMRSHPYVRYALANAIIQYRLQHGNYAAVADLKKIMTLTEAGFNKVSPYLTVQ